MTVEATIPPLAPKPKLRVLLCAPRSFCAGVVRAIETVERALDMYGPPVYVRHEIVHNRYVVDTLRAKGAIFVEDLAEIPDTDAPVVFSAHGVPKSVPDEAQRRGLEIALIGHAGHPEVVGTIGQLPPGAVTLIETLADAAAFAPRDPARLAYITQTTLSVDDTAEIVALLKRRFPAIVSPHKE